MSLLEDFYKEYHIMNKTTVDDPEGGWITGWAEGATVKMALDDPTQTQRMIADANKVEVIQNAVFPKGTPVVLGAYLRSVDDASTVYLVQTNPVDAPAMAGLQLMKAEVIKTRLPA